MYKKKLFYWEGGKFYYPQSFKEYIVDLYLKEVSFNMCPKCKTSKYVRLTKKINQRKYRFYCSNCVKSFEKCTPEEYELCEKCRGDGFINKNIFLKCQYCNGKGVIDWVSKLTKRR